MHGPLRACCAALPGNGDLHPLLYDSPRCPPAANQPNQNQNQPTQPSEPAAPHLALDVVPNLGRAVVQVDAHQPGLVRHIQADLRDKGGGEGREGGSASEGARCDAAAVRDRTHAAPAASGPAQPQI
jgi:hypothetical protein